MEPANLNSSPESDADDARLAAWVREQAGAAPLPDAGFSTRVLAALPPRRRAFSGRRVIACAGGAAVGALATRLDLGEWPTAASIFAPVGDAIRAAAALTLDPWMVAGVAIAVMFATVAAVVLLVLRDEETA